MMKKYKTSFPVYLPEELGFIDNVYAHIRTLFDNETLETTTKVTHINRYVSTSGTEWPKIFNNSNEIIKCSDLKSSFFSFPIEYDEGILGEYFFTFTACKDNILTEYHTNTQHFIKSQTLKIW